jgi:hypothetical protein
MLLTARHCSPLARDPFRATSRKASGRHEGEIKHVLRLFLTPADGAMMISAEARSNSWRYQEVKRFK